MIGIGLPCLIASRKLFLVFLWVFRHDCFNPFMRPPAVRVNLHHVLQNKMPLFQQRWPPWVMCVWLPPTHTSGATSFHGASVSGLVPHRWSNRGHGMSSMRSVSTLEAHVWLQSLQCHLWPILARLWPDSVRAVWVMLPSLCVLGRGGITLLGEICHYGFPGSTTFMPTQVFSIILFACCVFCDVNSQK